MWVSLYSLFAGWVFAGVPPSLKSSIRSKRSCVATEEVCIHWQLPAVELHHRSHDCFFLIFVWAGSCHISCTGELAGPQKPEEFFKSLSWRHSRAQRYQGPGLLSRNSTLRFQAAFLSDPAAFRPTIVNCLPSLVIMRWQTWALRCLWSWCLRQLWKLQMAINNSAYEFISLCFHLFKSGIGDVKLDYKDRWWGKWAEWVWSMTSIWSSERKLKKSGDCDATIKK